MSLDPVILSRLRFAFVIAFPSCCRYTSLATMRHALELGINWIDTAAVYGLGHTEEVVGRLLRELPASKRPLVFTKCGLIWDEHDPMAPPRQVLKPDSIRRECCETGTAVEDSWAAMAKLVEEGKVSAAGVSNFDVTLLDRCEAIRHVDSLQPPFSLINRAAANNPSPRGPAPEGTPWYRQGHRPWQGIPALPWPG